MKHFQASMPKFSLAAERGVRPNRTPDAFVPVDYKTDRYCSLPTLGSDYSSFFQFCSFPFISLLTTAIFVIRSYNIPHPLALLSLLPLNERAESVVSHPNNDHNVFTLNTGARVLDVGFHLSGKSPPTTLATLKRGVETDIFVEGTSISKLQCSFTIDFDTGIIMFHDHSKHRTNQVRGKYVMGFEDSRVRRILVQPGVMARIRIGGSRQNLVHVQFCGRVVGSRQAPTGSPSPQDTRIDGPKMRYVLVGPPLGSGSYGVMFKATDVDSRKFMAVKMLKQPTKASQFDTWKKSVVYALKREVKILSEIGHHAAWYNNLTATQPEPNINTNT
ncbi:hypothetical protein G7Y89_g13966 [Cudoniella acicularis]|uniref:Protein kinase domain-containing protein n=1 Tax=Cudoniella acicularis TaxID=354080 RepID=A0A8H4VVX9_9HELO|nr:hypothetical protein G7Y89_g13966 [Cudoniella acicularis]